LEQQCRGSALALNNNLAELAAKPFATDKKTWLSFATNDAGRHLAILSNFTATCQ